MMMLLKLVPLLIWIERKGAAFIQDRRGPNRATAFGIIRLGGIVHSIADAIKLITKTDFSSEHANKALVILAPIIAVFVAISVSAVIPFAEAFTINGVSFQLQISDLNAGLIYIFALSSLSIYALLLAGWGSNSKFSLLGAVRASSQMVSYEIALGLSVVPLFMLSESFRINDIVASQGVSLLSWNIVRAPLAFILFFTALFAEANRTPFDLPEGEAELTAGFHTEYSSMRFALFFLGEYTHIIVGSLLVTMLFFGGWNIPYVSSEYLHHNIEHVLRLLSIGGAVFAALGAAGLFNRFVKRRGFWGDLRDYESFLFAVILAGLAAGLAAAVFALTGATLPEWVGSIAVFLLQMIVVLTKTLFFIWTFIWVRWTLPRFRYDQLMKLGWKVMIPLGILNIFVTGVVLLLTH
ncbi:MAG: NADH-quinone oxidoreductase subunit H [Deltaproteobacteria bacterium CG_4_10_14_0_2_um_filter_43_8]|nr:MAG: NADH-quinone oxidoreductase subunit H [Deltaproteobacteria bacterium CG_4_10_14_0_2_um_filter_43_8]PJC64760.1 MAG: NADH-quinone oxidoreductase subunit H [Deltaproteobacteria bacterium CG_4_9_14_0_2_um_filter_42_21]